jgi:hypothetical protein
MSITTYIDPNLVAHNTSIVSSGTTLTGATIGWQDAHVLAPRIEKVTNGYTVSINKELYIAENVEAVTGIISAQLLKLGVR